MTHGYFVPIDVKDHIILTREGELCEVWTVVGCSKDPGGTGSFTLQRADEGKIATLELSFEVVAHASDTFASVLKALGT